MYARAIETDQLSSEEAYLVEANFDPMDLKHRRGQSRSFLNQINSFQRVLRQI